MAFGGLLAVVVLAVAVPLVAGFEEGKTFSDIFFSFLAKCCKRELCACACVPVWV